MWDFLTLRDIYQLRSVSKFTYEELALVEYNRCRDGKGEIICCVHTTFVISRNLTLHFFISHAP